MRSVFLFLALATIIGSSAKATDSNHAYYTLTYGAASCGTYLEARLQRGRDESAFKSWLEGYITAVNESLSHTYDIRGGVDLEGLLGWLDNYCKANPTQQFAEASDELIGYLYPKRTQEEPK